MDVTKGSNAIVATVSFYVEALAEREAEITRRTEELKANGSLFAKLGFFLEQQVEGLSVKTPEEAVTIAVDALRMAKQNAALLFAQAEQTGKAEAGLREALVFAGANEANDGHTPVLVLVGRVSKALVDLKSKMAGRFDPAVEERAHYRDIIINAARAWATSTAPSRAVITQLRAAVQKLDARDLERLKREAAVLTAARAYGESGGSDLGTGSFARELLREASINLAALDLKPS